MADLMVHIEELNLETGSYRFKSPEEIFDRAEQLTGKTLYEVLDLESGIVSSAHTKGKIGQEIQEKYFFMKNDNESRPDFETAQIELKVTPIRATKKKGYKAKERLVLNTIDYLKVPEEKFNTFLKKNSHILIIFYVWEEGKNLYEFRIDKVVDWIPTKDEKDLIKKDWDLIQ